jgi:hypothetical protein
MLEFTKEPLAKKAAAVCSESFALTSCEFGSESHKYSRHACLLLQWTLARSFPILHRSHSPSLPWACSHIPTWAIWLFSSGLFFANFKQQPPNIPFPSDCDFMTRRATAPGSASQKNAGEPIGSCNIINLRRALSQFFKAGKILQENCASCDMAERLNLIRKKSWEDNLGNGLLASSRTGLTLKGLISGRLRRNCPLGSDKGSSRSPL